MTADAAPQISKTFVEIRKEMVERYKKRWIVLRDIDELIIFKDGIDIQRKYIII